MPGVVLRAYPALNHLLVAGSGPPNPGEYGVPCHVQLVANLATWIAALPATKNAR
jgi:hypothetical protein